MTLIILYQNKNKDKKTTWLATRALLVFASKAIKQIQIPTLTYAILRGYKICPTNFTGSLKKHPLLFLRPTFSWYYNVIVGRMMTLQIFLLSHQVVSMFQSNIFEHIFKHINAPLSDLYWKTEKCRSKD